MDIRGQGLSEKPPDGYGDSKLWANDVQAVITELGLERPIISGWSYGGMLICELSGVYGEADVGGLHFVSAVTKLRDGRGERLDRTGVPEQCGGLVFDRR